MLEGYVTVEGERQRSYGVWSPYSVVYQRTGKRVIPTQAQYEALYPRARERTLGPAEALALIGDGPFALEMNELPIVVLFRSPDVPGSGQVVQPEQVPELFPGVSWGTCTLQITDDGVDYGAVRSILPWTDVRGLAAPEGVNGNPFTIVNDDFVRNRRG